ncbi:MAG TPA: zf-HC2 domain-containing protein [Pyrinomonadaceae bacterium]|jgi:anti-sigma factor RsiW|nr:zf-HC2 domain-containing protein [Pyrinomonadaceae bacterium]
MKERDHSPSCERAPDLIAFIYNEASEQEAQDFQLHLRECSSCREEAASFGFVRESIITWRDEALAGFVSTPVTTHDKKSALTALRQFFDLSPLWLKGATAFALLAFCLLVGIVIFRNRERQIEVTSKNPNAVYTEQDVNRIVKEALAKATPAPPVETPAEKPQTVKYQKPKTAQFAKSRRPLSRAEREQLAADLRLLSTGDDEALHLLGDRINQE